MSVRRVKRAVITPVDLISRFSVKHTVAKDFLLISFLSTGYKGAFNNLSRPLRPALAFGFTF